MSSTARFLLHRRGGGGARVTVPAAVDRRQLPPRRMDDATIHARPSSAMWARLRADLDRRARLAPVVVVDDLDDGQVEQQQPRLVLERPSTVTLIAARPSTAVWTLLVDGDPHGGSYAFDFIVRSDFNHNQTPAAAATYNSRRHLNRDGQLLVMTTTYSCMEIPPTTLLLLLRQFVGSLVMNGAHANLTVGHIRRLLDFDVDTPAHNSSRDQLLVMAPPTMLLRQQNHPDAVSFSIIGASMVINGVHVNLTVASRQITRRLLDFDDTPTYHSAISRDQVLLMASSSFMQAPPTMLQPLLRQNHTDGSTIVINGVRVNLTDGQIRSTTTAPRDGKNKLETIMPASRAAKPRRTGQCLLLRARVKEGATSGQLLDQQETPGPLLFVFGARRTLLKDKKRPRDSHCDAASAMPKKRPCRCQAAPRWNNIIAHFPILEPVSHLAIDIPRALRVRTVSNLLRNNNTNNNAHPSPASVHIQIYGNGGGNMRRQRWIFFIKVLSLLCVIYGTTGALAVASAKIVRGQFVFGWRIPPWAVYLIQLFMWWAVVKPMAHYRAVLLVRKLLPLACFASNSVTALFVSSKYGGYSGLRPNMLLPLVLSSVIPYSIWSVGNDKELELKPLFWWCFSVLVVVYQCDSAGWIPLPGRCNMTDYLATLAAAVFLLEDVIQADFRKPIFKTFISIYTETSVETGRGAAVTTILSL